MPRQRPQHSKNKIFSSLTLCWIQNRLNSERRLLKGKYTQRRAPRRRALADQWQPSRSFMGHLDDRGDDVVVDRLQEAIKEYLEHNQIRMDGPSVHSVERNSTDRRRVLEEGCPQALPAQPAPISFISLFLILTHLWKSVWLRLLRRRSALSRAPSCSCGRTRSIPSPISTTLTISTA